MGTENNIGVDQDLDTDFYGIWHKDLHHLNEQDLISHWKRHGHSEGRYPNPIALTEKFAWPISISRWASKVSAVLSKSMDKDAAHRELLSFVQLKLIQGLEGSNNSRLGLTAFDWKFYTSWYSDLKHLSQDEAKLHWSSRGKSEKRCGNLRDLCLANKLDPNKIPEGFDPRGYALINADLKLPDHKNLYTLAYHFLSEGYEKNRSFYFDPYFYSVMYDDLKHISDANGLFDHYKLHGRLEMRFPNLVAYLNANNGKTVLGHLRREMQISDVLSKNPHLSTNTLTETVVDVIRRHPAQRTHLFSTDQENADFYADLGAFWEQLGELDRARKTYFTSLSFSTNLKALERLGIHYTTQKMTLAAHPFLKTALTRGSERIDVADAYLNSKIRIPTFEAVNDLVKTFPTFKAEKHIYLLSDQLWKQLNASSKALAVSNDRKEIKNSAAKYASEVREAFSMYYNRYTAGTKLQINLRRSRVLIIGDPYIAQCVRYRIDQKVAQLSRGGFEVKQEAWNASAETLLSEILYTDVIIFYRCPATPALLRVVEKAKTLGKICIYDIDDLIFTDDYPAPIETYGSSIDEEQYFDLCVSFPLYAEMAKACHFGMASTKPIAAKLSDLVIFNQSIVHRNGLDKYSIIRDKNHKKTKHTVDLFYGSATLAHNSDFTKTLLPVLVNLMRKRKFVRLILVGHVAVGNLIPTDLAPQVKLIPHIADVSAYLEILGQADINLAVLDSNSINDAKSEIKWLEAAAMGIPSVVSDTANYKEVIKHNETGILANNFETWSNGLLSMVDDPSLRETIGNQAKMHALNEYAEEILSKSLTTSIHQMIDQFENSGHAQA